MSVGQAGTVDTPHAPLDFFGLREQPFAPTASDPRYFYPASCHKECLFRLRNSIVQRHGLAVVLGNHGTGKTSLLRHLVTGITADRGQYHTAVIESPIPTWTSFALLESIVTQFGLHPEKPSFAAYLESFSRHLNEHRDRINTLIVDDAQNLDQGGQLELLRLIQNLETPQHKLVNVVLFARLEWAHILRATPSFEQRINLTYTLTPLDVEETGEMIAFRLRQAGATDDRAPVFDREAIRTIHAYAEGCPRVIVTLCRNALLVAGQLQTRRIGRDTILRTVEKTMLPYPERTGRVEGTKPAGPDMMAGLRAPIALGAVSGATPVAAPARNPRDQRAARILLRAARGKRAVEPPVAGLLPADTVLDSGQPVSFFEQGAPEAEMTPPSLKDAARSEPEMMPEAGAGFVVGWADEAGQPADTSESAEGMAEALVEFGADLFEPETTSIPARESGPMGLAEAERLLQELEQQPRAFPTDPTDPLDD